MNVFISVILALLFYFRQTEQERERLKRHIVKQKYFKTEKQPNFLTWAEKEQIRQLHGSDAVEWSTEKLTQSFPAPETVIKKIIKSRWAHEDLNHISRHDTSVQKNWKALLSGRLKLDPQVQEHLMKFAKRNQAGLAHTFLKNSNYCENVLVPVENVEGEFSNMVKMRRGENVGIKQLMIPAFSGQHVDETSSKESSVRGCSSDSDTFLLDSDAEKPRKTTKLVTLTQYKQAFNLDGVDVENTVASNISCGDVDQRQGNSLRTVKESKGVLGSEKLGMSIHLQYPEQITIPKSKWREGGTYKAGDCYYDDDGHFLYRVPGMK